MQIETAKKKNFIEIKYTGYANGEVFDSNIEEDVKKLHENAKAEKSVIVVGEGMVVPGLDKNLEGKEIGKEYEIIVPFKEGFGERKRELIKTIPLSAFKGKEVMPRVGMVLALDQYLAKVIAISGARVVADLNNPLAGKDLKYKIKIVRKVEDDKEKAEAYFKFFLGVSPDTESREKEIVVKLPKNLEKLIDLHKIKFKELVGKDLTFEEKKEEKYNHEHGKEHEHKH
ncbi:MAG: FKBP-type peptidyl-prolyl cis-trans isomerase [Nanoarchaeota archaeon]